MSDLSNCVRAIRLQAQACVVFGSAFSGAVLERAADDLELGGPTAAILAPWADATTRTLMTDAVPIHLLGALHDIALSGEAPALSAAYPAPDRSGDVDAAWTEARAVIADRPHRISTFMAHEPQTNEVRRSACLIGGFLTIAAETGLPLRCFEVGASAGLNQLWDRFFYRLGDVAAWGDPASSVVIDTDWRGRAPPVDAPVRVIERAACDRAPIDLAGEIARRRLRAYVWADQIDRMRRLEAAIALGLGDRVRVLCPRRVGRRRPDRRRLGDRRLARCAGRTAPVAEGAARRDRRRRDRRDRAPGDLTPAASQPLTISACPWTLGKTCTAWRLIGSSRRGRRSSSGCEGRSNVTRRARSPRCASRRLPRWVVNQIVRTQPKALQALFASGDDLARAQARAAAGKGGGDAMRDATHRQRDAVRELLEAAEGLLDADGQGVSPATIERVGETLRAAANDDDARQQVAGGCLTRELRFVGVGLGGLAPSSGKSERAAKAAPAKGKAPSRARNAEAEAKAKAKAKAEAQAKAEAEAERVAARERAAALKAARRIEGDARRAAARAQKELAAAQARHEEAAASLREAETLLSDAVRRAEDAAAKLTAAQQALGDLGQP